MSTIGNETPQLRQGEEQPFQPREMNAVEYGRDYVQRLRGGEMGAVPGLIGLVVLVILFAILQSGFLSAYNVENMVIDGAPTIIMAMGLVFVLLLGEIDLSAGTASGLCAVLAAVLLVRHQVNWVVAVFAAGLLGVVIGASIGWLRAKVGIPSFVITLAAFLSFQGVTVIMVGGSGSILVTDHTLVALESASISDYMPIWAGWLMLAIVVLGYAVVKFRTLSKRRAAGLSTEPNSIALIKIAALAALGAVFIYYMGINRIITHTFLTSNQTSEGVPWIVPLMLILLFALTFLLGRTRYGRHVYAVGGNDEAARRAGIRVDMVRISVFVICSFLAALSGLVQLSSQAGVNSAQGGGNTLLLAVGAAVIGGTSLFGGRGRVIDAVIGGVVVEVISYGMSDLISGSNGPGWQQIITGIVLLVAAGFDAVSRRAGLSRQ
ncbi:ABC transporter permease [Actinospica sp. MGRD01-02]|uniref:Xylose transport system permease protein XylH n=1 Tax=Actinospica acidithermotolerans TaxID=2828514 RepID=A0A941EBP1_9ACTN|nr:ABC transporter permease [Actinospica acidithermotolerans]MBR7826089.1 ABC transporter permease [Actinospica acidithermotolerans]